MPGHLSRLSFLSFLLGNHSLCQQCSRLCLHLARIPTAFSGATTTASCRSAKPTLKLLLTSFSASCLKPLWAKLLFLQRGSSLKSTLNFSVFQQGKFSCCSCSFNPPHSHIQSGIWSLLLHIFGHLCEASRNPKPAEVGAGLAQDVVKETRGLTAIREPHPGFKHKTQYFLRG